MWRRRNLRERTTNFDSWRGRSQHIEFAATTTELLLPLASRQSSSSSASFPAPRWSHFRWRHTSGTSRWGLPVSRQVDPSHLDWCNEQAAPDQLYRLKKHVTWQLGREKSWRGNLTLTDVLPNCSDLQFWRFESDWSDYWTDVVCVDVSRFHVVEKHECFLQFWEKKDYQVNFSVCARNLNHSLAYRKVFPM